MSDLKPDLLTYFRQLSEEEPVLILNRTLSPETEVNNENVIRLSVLESKVQHCTLCELAKTRLNVVFGTGDPQARILFIGEAPGADEDRQGEPFVGRAGKLLNRILKAMNLERHQVYIANILKCRPPGNRDPNPDEAAACLPYLTQQIEFIQPDVIIALGKVAALKLLDMPPNTPVKSLRGRIFDYLGHPFVVTYHPAALLRNPGFKAPLWEDMQMVMKLLAGEIEWKPDSEQTLL
ncbi:uracil-DNA glycosylase [bacterium]|nr:uracil-DNA glycosylase [bacterium]